MTRLGLILLPLVLAASLILLPGGCPNSTTGSNGNSTTGTSNDSSTDAATNDSSGDTSDDAAGGTQDDHTGDADNEDTDTDDEGGGTDVSGTRTVTALPPAGYLKPATVLRTDVAPTDSTLAKVIFGGMLCAGDNSDLTGSLLYEIDATGVVLNSWLLAESNGTKMASGGPPTSEMHFEIEDGCLHLSTATTTTDDESDPNSVVSPEPNPCGDDAMSISQQGVDPEPTGQYICVESHITSMSHDCSVEGDAWTDQQVITGYYVSLGTLEGISLAEWATACDPDHPDATGTVTAGDRVEFTFTYSISYTVSASPAELGYTVIGTVPF